MSEGRDLAEYGWDERLGLPTSNRDQSCAFCGRARPSFAHRLDAGSVGFRWHGKSHTLPTFVASCSDCEALMAGQDDTALVARRHFESDDEEYNAAFLAAIRAADLGPNPLKDVG
jgi:hypothetical protein